MRIAFDLDGVLHDWHGAVWYKYFKHEFNDYEEFWKKHWESVAEERWQPILHDEEMYTKDASAAIVNMLHKLSLKYHVYYITLRPQEFVDATRKWLSRNGFPDPSHLFVVKESKVPTCKKLEIDLVIEDRIPIMNELADNGFQVIGVKQPWNEDKITEYPHVEGILRLEREIARVETARKVHGRRNGNS